VLQGVFTFGGDLLEFVLEAFELFLEVQVLDLLEVYGLFEFQVVLLEEGVFLCEGLCGLPGGVELLVVLAPLVDEL